MHVCAENIITNKAEVAMLPGSVFSMADALCADACVTGKRW